MRIGSTNLDSRVLIVAEIGNNHEGRLEVARALVEAAATAGADAVKFQTIRPERLVRPTELERLAQLRRFELSVDGFAELAELAHGRGLAFLSTPFDVQSVADLEPFVDAYKVASGDNDFVALLERVAATGRPVLLSTGMADLPALRRSVELLDRVWGSDGHRQRLVVLQCVSAYPTPAESANLAVIPTLREHLGCTVGFSDHTVGIDAAPFAVAAGARVVEKHFTLDHDYSEYRDHKLSLEPSELSELVRRIRDVEALLGSGEKRVEAVEVDTAAAARRSIASARALRTGHRLETGDLTWLRPAGGLRPGDEHLLLGKTLTRDLAAGEFVRLEDVE